MIFEGLDKQKTENLIEWMGEMRTKYTKNNQMIEDIEKVALSIVGESEDALRFYHTNYSSKFKAMKPSTPKFKQ
jgi:spore germination cell wall hydrolase CwlJ-like protein